MTGVVGAIERSGGSVHWVTLPGGVRLRAACWPAGERGVVLLLNGRTEFIEKYGETVAELQARGFAVWTLDWRGQGASSRALADRAANHVGHFDEYLGDLNHLVDHHVRPSLAGRKLLLLGHSMGGLVGAHFLSRRGALFAAAILSAPMIDFQRGRWGPRWAVGAMVRSMCLLPGQVRRYAPGVPRAPAVNRAFAGNRLTSCPDRHEADLVLLRENPALALGGVTWGWLRAALNSVAALEDPRVIAAIDMHVLVAMAADELVVDNRAIRRFALKLPRGKLVQIEGARHELLRERDPVRTAFWGAVDQFLAGLV